MFGMKKKVHVCPENPLAAQVAFWRDLALSGKAANRPTVDRVKALAMSQIAADSDASGYLAADLAKARQEHYQAILERNALRKQRDDAHKQLDESLAINSQLRGELSDWRSGRTLFLTAQPPRIEPSTYGQRGYCTCNDCRTRRDGNRG